MLCTCFKASICCAVRYWYRCAFHQAYTGPAAQVAMLPPTALHPSTPNPWNDATKGAAAQLIGYFPPCVAHELPSQRLAYMPMGCALGNGTPRISLFLKTRIGVSSTKNLHSMKKDHKFRWMDIELLPAPWRYPRYLKALTAHLPAGYDCTSQPPTQMHKLFSRPK